MSSPSDVLHCPNENDVLVLVLTEKTPNNHIRETWTCKFCKYMFIKDSDDTLTLKTKDTTDKV